MFSVMYLLVSSVRRWRVWHPWIKPLPFLISRSKALPPERGLSSNGRRTNSTHGPSCPRLSSIGGHADHYPPASPASRNGLPTLNVSGVKAAMFRLSPVLGLRPVRQRQLLVPKIPLWTIRTSSPLAKPSAMGSRRGSKRSRLAFSRGLVGPGARSPPVVFGGISGNVFRIVLFPSVVAVAHRPGFRDEAGPCGVAAVRASSFPAVPPTRLPVLRAGLRVVAVPLELAGRDSRGSQGRDEGDLGGIRSGIRGNHMDSASSGPSGKVRKFRLPKGVLVGDRATGMFRRQTGPGERQWKGRGREQVTQTDAPRAVSDEDEVTTGAFGAAPTVDRGSGLGH